DEIPRVFGDVKVLQQKRVLPHVHLHEGGSNHFGAKSKIAIEALADFEILGRNKWAQCNDATSGVARIWHGNLATLRRPTQNGGITGKVPRALRPAWRARRRRHIARQAPRAARRAGGRARYYPSRRAAFRYACRVKRPRRRARPRRR